MSRNLRTKTVVGAAAFLFLAGCLIALAVYEDSGARWIYLFGAACGIVAAVSVVRSSRT